MIKELVIGVVCGAAMLTVGILIGHFGIDKSSADAPSWAKDVARDVDESLVEKFLSEVDNVQIESNLRSEDERFCLSHTFCLLNFLNSVLEVLKCLFLNRIIADT